MAIATDAGLCLLARESVMTGPKCGEDFVTRGRVPASIVATFHRFPRSLEVVLEAHLWAAGFVEQFQ